MCFFIINNIEVIYLNINNLLKIPFDDLSSSDESKIVNQLCKQLCVEFKKNDRSGIYARTQKMMAYNSNKIEGSTLTSEQTASLFHTGTILSNGEIFRAKDIEEMTGHFSMFNEMIKSINIPLSEELIKKFHFRLKSGVFEDMANGYPVGKYKNRLNEVSNIETSRPDQVHERMSQLLSEYNVSKPHCLEELAWFHAEYEKIHPFQDGNGRTGRMILFRECLESGVIPVIITDKNKAEYYHSLNKAQTKNDFTDLTYFFQQEQREYHTSIQDFLYKYDLDKIASLDHIIDEAKAEIDIEREKNTGKFIDEQQK